MNDNRITIEVKQDGSTTITIYGAVNVVHAEPNDEQPTQEEPTDAQRHFLLSRNRWEGNLNKEQARNLIGEIKDQETAASGGIVDSAASALLKNNIRPDFLSPHHFEDPLPFEAPMKRKRGRPRRDKAS